MNENPTKVSWPFLTSRFHDALLMASQAHATQYRKGGQIPYISHLLGVCAIVLKAGGTENQAIASLLHDVLEDQSDKVSPEMIRNAFGQAVETMVIECTDETPETRRSLSWKERKTRYLQHLSVISEETRLVVISDKLDNLRDIDREYRQMGKMVWQKFSGKEEGTKWFYQQFLSRAKEWREWYQRRQNVVIVKLIDEFEMICTRLC